MDRSCCVATLVMALVAGAGAACAPAANACSADDNCATGMVCREGLCVQAPGGPDAGGGGARDGGAADAARAPDAGLLDAAMQQQGDAGPGSCVGTDDDVLTAAELPLGLGIPLRYVEVRDAGPVAVDLAGTVSGGRVTWDFSAAQPGDTPVTVEARALAGLWFASEFPAGEYVVPLDGTGDLLGIYRRTTTEVLLLGEATAHDETTLLKHDPAIVVLRLPLQLGAAWSTTTTTRGTLQGNAFYTSTDTYEMSADARGVVKTPAGQFSSQRVRVVQTVSVPILVFPWTLEYRWVRYSFLSPCYSQVAHVGSTRDETELLFTSAAEFRRLGLP